MNTYIWRKNFTATYTNQENIIRGKLAFKTKEIHWLETEKPVIILISINSAFHEAIWGDLKMNALMSTIKSNVKGKITVLLSDMAHIQTISLNHYDDLKKAFEECLISAHALCHRYQSYFRDCNVVYWHSYICEDKNFFSFLNFLKDSYQKDHLFRKFLHRDAEATYTSIRSQKFINKALYIEKAIEDILEQCASLMVLAHKGYRFQFYPGRPYGSIKYVNHVFIPEDKQVFWVDVFLTIEKKTIIPQNSVSDGKR